jgi:hypothetical protein
LIHTLLRNSSSNDLEESIKTFSQQHAAAFKVGASSSFLQFQTQRSPHLLFLPLLFTNYTFDFSSRPYLFLYPLSPLFFPIAVILGRGRRC